MCSNLNHAVLGLAGWLALSLVLTAPADDRRPKTERTAPKSAQELPEIQLRGKVVGLPEEMHRLHQAELPTRHEHLYGFKTEEGTYFTLLRTKYSEALFGDDRVREKELLLKGRLFPKTQIFEPITLRSVRDGVVNDLFYYCSVCEIFAVAPGICECCQGPTELIEKPVKARR